MINRVILVGNLTRDAETLTTTGKPMTRMRIATNFHWRDGAGERQETTEYHTVVAFARLAEICALYCVRGKRVYIEGRLRTREYDAGDSVKRTTTEIIAETVRMLQPRDPAVGVVTDGGREAKASGKGVAENAVSAAAISA